MINHEMLHENAEGIYLSMHSLYERLLSRCKLCKFSKREGECKACKIPQLLSNAEKFISLVNEEVSQDINTVEENIIVEEAPKIKKKRGRPKKVKSEELFK